MAFDSPRNVRTVLVTCGSSAIGGYANLQLILCEMRMGFRMVAIDFHKGNAVIRWTRLGPRCSGWCPAGVCRHGLVHWQVLHLKVKTRTPAHSALAAPSGSQIIGTSAHFLPRRVGGFTRWAPLFPSQQPRQTAATWDCQRKVPEPIRRLANSCSSSSDTIVDTLKLSLTAGHLPAELLDGD